MLNDVVRERSYDAGLWKVADRSKSGMMRGSLPA